MSITFNPEARDKKDRDLVVTFFADAVKDEAASEQQGRDVYKDVDWIRIHVPMDPHSDIEAVVDAMYAKRFKHEYTQYKQMKKEPLQGTPLAMWPAVSTASVRELQAIGVRTVEALSEVTPAEIRLNEWLKPHVQRAQTWLAALNDGEEVLRLKAKADNLEKRVGQLEAENAELLAERIPFRREANERRKKQEKTE